ncbi:MAG TPA: TIGR00730 family Rossman fold protein [Conexibacter sp.]|nr:TIGR00730 family Rossman fold protein [Conexibacter sp.]
MGLSSPPAPPRPRRLCVYAGAQAGSDARYLAAATSLVEAAAAHGMGLVFGGGGIGLMGALGDAALASGVETIGVIPRPLLDLGLAHDSLTELHVVDTLHERKALMAELGDAFVALPGGIGTLEEIVEALTWAQLGIHCKPTGLLDVAGYWRGLERMLDHTVREGFLRVEDRRRLHCCANPHELLARLAPRPEQERSGHEHV